MSGRRGTRRVVVLAVVCLVCLAPVGVAGAATTGGMGGQAAALQENQAATIADGEATVTGYSVPESVTLHRNFTVEATVNNTESSEVEKTIRVERGRDRLWSTIATHNVTVAGNTEKTVSFNATIHEGAPEDEQESVEDTRLRVAGKNATVVGVEASNVHIDPGHHEWGWIRDQHLNQGETTTVSASFLNGFERAERYEFRLRGGVYGSGRTFHRTLSIPVGEGKSVEAYPRFDAGGVHAVRANGRFLGFVNVSSPNVSVTNVGDLPNTVYEGTEHALDVTVANTGGETETFAVTTATTASSESTPGWTDTQIVTLGPGETQTVQRPVRFHTRGDHTVSVNNESTQAVTVEHPVSVKGYDVVGAEQYTLQNVTMTATLTNHRSTPASRDVEFSLWTGTGGRLSESLNDTKTVTVPGGETKTISNREFARMPGTYNATVDDRTVTTVEVTENPISPTSLSTPSGDVSVGDEPNIAVVLENDGSVDTYRRVTLIGPKGVYERNLSISAGETQTVTFAPTVTYRGSLEFQTFESRLTGTVSVPTPNLTVSMSTKSNVRTGLKAWVTPVLNNTGSTAETYVVPFVVEHDDYPSVRTAWRTTMSVSGDDDRSRTEFVTLNQPGNYTVYSFGEPAETINVTTSVTPVNGSLSNDTVEAGETATFEGAFRNPTNKSQFVALTVPETGYEEVKTIPDNATRTVSWQFGFLQSGTYDVIVHGDTYQIDVTANESESDSPSDGGSDSGSDESGDGSGSNGDGGDTSDGGNENTGGNGGDSSGDGGDSGGQESESSGDSSSSGGSSDGESTADENESESEESVVRVNATTAANGTMVAEASGSANETVVIEIAAANDSTGNAADGTGTAVTGVNVSLAANETFTVAVSTSEERPGTVPDGEPEPDVETVEYVDISHPELSEGEIAAASFTVAVGTERLEAMDASPGDVVVSRYDDGWERVQTTYRGQRGDAHVFEVESPGLSVFAVGVDRTDSTTATDTTATTDASTAVGGATTGGAAPGDKTTGDETGTETASGSSDGGNPGFGVLAAVLALLAAAAVARGY